MKELDKFIGIVEDVSKMDMDFKLEMGSFKYNQRKLYRFEHNSLPKISRGNIEFEIICSKYSLNWLRLNLGYLPKIEELPGHQMNDCNIRLKYNIGLDKLEVLKNLSSEARFNHPHTVCLYSNSAQFDTFCSDKTKIRRKAKIDIWSSSNKNYLEYRRHLKEIGLLKFKNLGLSKLYQLKNPTEYFNYLRK